MALEPKRATGRSTELLAGDQTESLNGSARVCGWSLMNEPELNAVFFCSFLERKSAQPAGACRAKRQVPALVGWSRTALFCRRSEARSPVPPAAFVRSDTSPSKFARRGGTTKSARDTGCPTERAR